MSEFVSRVANKVVANIHRIPPCYSLDTQALLEDLVTIGPPIMGDERRITVEFLVLVLSRMRAFVDQDLVSDPEHLLDAIGNLGHRDNLRHVELIAARLFPDMSAEHIHGVASAATNIKFMLDVIVYICQDRMRRQNAASGSHRKHAMAPNTDHRLEPRIVDAPILLPPPIEPAVVPPRPEGTESRGEKPTMAGGISPCVLPADIPRDDRPAGPAVQLGPPGEPCIVLGRKKKPLTEAQYTLIEALIREGVRGLTKDAMEAIRPSARRILKTLRTDADWAKVILMAGQTNGRYRIKM